MVLNRRTFMGLLAGTAAVGLAGAHSASYATVARPYKAIAFDGFPIFDPRPIFKLVETLSPGKALN